MGGRTRQAGVVLVEGLPGAGKTTTAELIAAGTGARFVREEAKDHPVIPSSLRARSTDDDFDAQCLDAWRHFVDALDEPWVLEGCALQSTVRFMFANRWTTGRIESYWRAFEQVVTPVTERFVLLSCDEARMRAVFAARGPDWNRKVSEWVASTPRGGDLVGFWLEYGALCDSLLSASGLPVERAPVRAILRP